jgi:hypothetical protein
MPSSLKWLPSYSPNSLPPPWGVAVSRLTETLTCDSHTHVRRKKLRAAVGRDLTAAQSIHDGRAERELWLARLAGSGNGRPQMSSNTPPPHGLRLSPTASRQHSIGIGALNGTTTGALRQFNSSLLQRILTHTFVGIRTRSRSSSTTTEVS